MNSPYRAPPKGPAPIERDRLVYTADVTSPRLWTPKTSTTSVTETSPSGFCVRGGEVPEWSWSGYLRQLGLSDFALVVRVRLEGSPTAAVRLWARQIKIGDVEMGYSVSVRPMLGQYRVIRYAGSAIESIVAWSDTPHLAPASEANEIELRMHGDHLMLLLNGEMQAYVQDASFGHGDLLLGVAGSAVTDVATFEHIEIWSTRGT